MRAILGLLAVLVVIGLPALIVWYTTTGREINPRTRSAIIWTLRFAGIAAFGYFIYIAFTSSLFQ